jgi:hypothetical protein
MPQAHRTRRSQRNFRRTSYPMSRVEQPAVMHLFPVKGLRPQQIQDELSDMWNERAFQLPEVEK